MTRYKSQMTAAKTPIDISGTIALAGAGKMGSAMLTGWLARGLDAKRVTVIEPAPSTDIAALAAGGIRLNPKQTGAVDTLVVALKPQTFGEVGATLKPWVGPVTLVVSIMAGTTIAALRAACGGAVVRAMPNTRPQSAEASPSRSRRKMSVPHSERPPTRCYRLQGRSNGSTTRA